MSSIVPTSLAFVWPLRTEYLLGWQAVLLFVALGALIVWMGKRSLAGLGPVRKWVAISLRVIVLALLVLIISGARWQRENKVVEVIVLRDISESTANVVGFPGKSLQTSLDEFLKSASETKVKQPDDRIGVVSFNSAATIDAIPNTTLPLDAHAIREVGRGTDIASAIQLAMATFGKDAMHRLLLVSDGNVTQGDLEAARTAAAAQHVPIDVMPLRYDVKNEVLIERFIAPSWRREDEPFSIDVILRATNPPATGTLTVVHGDQPMDLDPDTPGVQPTRRVTLRQERNVERVAVPPQRGSDQIHQFKATFNAPNASVEGIETPGAPVPGTGVAGSAPARPGSTLVGDTILQNNTANAFTFVRGKGKILYVDNVPDGRGQLLRQALASQGLELDRERLGVEQFPRTLLELQNYDAVILANVPRGVGGLGEEQQRNLATYVHDMGGGLVMIGGEDSFGAGGWQGSKLEEVLPVNMDIPATRVLPKGALVLIMHSCEMPSGNYWGEQCAIKAIETLSAQDEIGIISFGWNPGGSQWDFPLSTKGDGSKVISAVKNMKLGDMPSFDDAMDVALNGLNRDGVGGLVKSDARQKHVIIISDGDPGAPNQALINQYLQAKVSVSTVSVYPHDTSAQGLPPTMRDIANALKGRPYGPIDANPNQLPQIFIKEATVVRRSLISEDRNGMDVRLSGGGASSEVIKGLTALPSVYGLVLTSRKDSPQVDMPLVAGKNADPLLAHWQTGLGRAAAWTSDAYNKWSANWVSSGGYEKFWAQVVRWVARPPMSTDFDVRTVQEGDKGKITVEAINRDARFLNFLSVGGAVVAPDGTKVPVRLVQTGPGTYEGEFPVDQTGNYVSVLQSRGPDGKDGVMLSGIAVNGSPELRDLKSNDPLLRDIATRSGGRMIDPFDAVNANLFSRDGLIQTASPLPIWDILIPILLAMLILDVAVRRIAWDWLATKRAVAGAADYVRSFTTVRKVESKPTLDALKRVRGEVAEQKFKVDDTGVSPGQTPAEPRPDPKRKFEAKGVEGDITQVVGGATGKPIPSAPKKIEPKGVTPGPGGHTGSLLEAKRRAQQQIKQKEQGEG
jgi:uncharacterized membrane protein